MPPRPRNFRGKEKLISVSEGKLYVTVLAENPSSDVPNWKAVGNVGKQMHSPGCLKSPLEKEMG